MAFPDTKFLVPRQRAATVDRPALVRSLIQDVLAGPLTVVCAPAGYGKTTVAAMVATSPDVSAHWVSMDPDDNDPHRFLTGIAAALGPVLAGAASTVLSGNSDPDLLRRAATAMLNAVTKASSDIVVVLDECEVITQPAVGKQLEFLINWAPDNLHFLLTCRRPPEIGLARLRAHGRLAERHAVQLRFTRSETEALLNGSLRLDLPASTVERVHVRTEGWPAGVRLLAASAGGDWALPSGTGHVFDFLADEVFDRQPADIQRFLLETSVLSTLSARAGAEVSGRTDAADVLAEVAMRGLFLTEQGDKEIYRYHSLFVEFLHRKLGRWPERERAALYDRAARAETDPMAAARHLLAAGDPSAAADLLETAGAAQLRLGRLTSVRELLERLPLESRERPGLLVLTGDLAFAAGELAAARSAFERAGPTGEVAARLADCLVLLGEIDASDSLITRTLAGSLDARLRVRLLLTRARVAQIRGQFEAAEQALGEGLGAAVDSSAMVVAAANLSPAVNLIHGAVDHLERFTEIARPVLSSGLPRLQVDGIAASVDLFRGRLAQAASTVDRVLAGYEQFGGAPPFLAYALITTKLLGLGPSTAGLEPTIDDLLREASSLSTASFMYPNAWFMIGRARWFRGQIAEAREARALMGSQDDAPPGSAWLITLNRLSLDGLIAIAEGDHRRAETALTAAVQQEAQMPLMNIYGSARIRLAYLYTERGRPEQALAVAMPALAECELLPGRILIEGLVATPVLRLASARSPFAARLLHQLEHIQAPQPMPVPGTPEILTAREVEVLHLLVDGATNKDIAQRLMLGEETVKTHIARILRKLGVRSRTAAAAQARKLGITS